jgi:heme-degrading monooxygenase HmoA
MLSLSFWRDEAAVARWRNQTQHRATQMAGRSGVFRDYRLRVAAVVRDYGMSERREEAPQDSREKHG